MHIISSFYISRDPRVVIADGFFPFTNSHIVPRLSRIIHITIFFKETEEVEKKAIPVPLFSWHHYYYNQPFLPLVVYLLSAWVFISLTSPLELSLGQLVVGTNGIIQL